MNLSLLPLIILCEWVRWIYIKAACRILTKLWKEEMAAEVSPLFVFPPAEWPAEGSAVCLHIPAEEPKGPGDAPTHGALQEPVRREWLPHRPRRTTLWGESEKTAWGLCLMRLFITERFNCTLYVVRADTMDSSPSRSPSWKEWNSLVQATTAAVLIAWRRHWDFTCMSTSCAKRTVKASVTSPQAVASTQPWQVSIWRFKHV